MRPKFRERPKPLLQFSKNKPSHWILERVTCEFTDQWEEVGSVHLGTYCVSNPSRVKGAAIMLYQVCAPSGRTGLATDWIGAINVLCSLVGLPEVRRSAGALREGQVDPLRRLHSEPLVRVTHLRYQRLHWLRFRHTTTFAPCYRANPRSRRQRTQAYARGALCA